MNYDIGIIGAGVSGVFAALRLAEKHKDLKVVVFEFGPPPPNCLREDPLKTKRRRRQLEGWMGCFPTGDGKIYMEENTNKLLEIVDGRRVHFASKWFDGKLTEINGNRKLIKNKIPNQNIKTLIKNSGFDYIQHEYEQWYPDDIHKLAKISADRIEEAGNVYLSFDTEVLGFKKKRGKFNLDTTKGLFKCKKLILGSGRSGWRWINEIYKQEGLLLENNLAKFGIRMEMPASAMKGFNKAHFSICKDDLSIGPVSWKGSIIQEDHADMTIAAFRSNEARWKTDKVFFSVKRIFEADEDPCKYLDRIARLSHLLSGDRVGREKVKTFLQGLSDLGYMPEYNWINNTLKEIEHIFPNIIARGYFHVPDIDTTSFINNIEISSNLETQIEGLFVAGECSGVSGIAAAGISGMVAAEGASK